jgi:tetratricopeptide (TPR) repeat protein
MHRRNVILLAALGGAVSALGCAPHHHGMVGTTTVTSASVSDYDSEARFALVRGHNANALEYADDAIARSPKSGWPHYERGSALAGLGRTDEAVDAYRSAEARFGHWSNKAIAIYGRARVLDDAGRCEEAKSAYDEYAAVVRPYDEPRANTAMGVAAQCVARAPYDELSAHISDAVSAQAWNRVIALSGEASTAQAKNPWLQYQRAISLAALRKTDQAVAAFDLAAASFPKDDVRGRSVAIYGKARALVDAGRCESAGRAYEEYARLVNDTDPASAKMAREYASACAR